jgi:RelB Antitoxin alpha helical domain
MLTIKKRYIVNERAKKVAVQLDIKTYEKIERLLEDYVLADRIKENREEDRLELNEAKSFYTRLKKSA